MRPCACERERDRQTHRNIERSRDRNRKRIHTCTCVLPSVAPLSICRGRALMALAAVTAELDPLLPVCSLVKPGDLEGVSLLHSHLADRTGPCRERRRDGSSEITLSCVLRSSCRPSPLGLDCGYSRAIRSGLSANLSPSDHCSRRGQRFPSTLGLQPCTDTPTTTPRDWPYPLR